MLAAADPSSHHRQALIQRARQSVLLGAGGEASLEPWITRSWQRCLAAGLHPGHKVVFNPISGQALRQLADESHALVQAARPVLYQLTRAISGMRYFAMLTNARGVVIDVQGAVNRHDPRSQLIGRVGVDLSEAAVGTTAIGAALTELTPVWLHRGEHFCDDNSAYSCAGAPLFDPEGRCMGMLNLTGADVPERPELRHLVARSARSIEDALLLSRPHDWLMRVELARRRTGRRKRWPGHAGRRRPGAGHQHHGAATAAPAAAQPRWRSAQRRCVCHTLGHAARCGMPAAQCSHACTAVVGSAPASAGATSCSSSGPRAPQALPRPCGRQRPR